MRFPYILLALFVFLVTTGAARAQIADEQSILQLAQSYEQGGQYEDALRFYSDLLTHRPQNTTYFEGVKRCLISLKRYDEAIQYIDRRFSQDPRDAQLLVVRGGIRMLQGEKDSAVADWERAVAINVRDGRVYSLVADQCVNSREYATAVEYLRRGRAALGAPQMYVFEIARASAMNMDFDTAMDEYLNYLVQAPSTLYQIQQQVAQFSELPEALESAVRMTQRKADAYPKDLTLRTLLSWLYMERKDYFGALAVYREMDELKNGGGMEVLRFAQRALNEGAYKPAAEAFSELIDKYPKAPYISDAEFQYARCVEEMGADPELPGALDPGSGGTKYPSTETVASYDGAIRLYEKITEKYPQHPVSSDALYRIAWIKFHRFRDNDGALAILEPIAVSRSRQLGKKDAMLLAGDVLIAQGRLEPGLTQYNAVLSEPGLDPRDRDLAVFRAAEALYFQGSFDSSVSLLQPLTENSDRDIANDALTLITFVQRYRKPGDVPLQRFATAEYYVRQHRSSEAAALFEDIITSFSTSDLRDHAMLRAAELYEELQQPKNAEAKYLSLIDGIEDSILRDKAMFRLGVLYEETLRDPEHATDMYQKLLAAYPWSRYGNEARSRILGLRKEHS